jgi:ubiquinone/menaquinone biosynthesis C-methylase UbiE
MDFENEYDIIFSWETFEHIINPKESLKRIYKALKPGGVSFHNYNPFFCSSGGHSMCTLDYPFAHILLTNKDFKKYTTEVIPENPPEKYSELSYNFFTKNLNRMTQQDLKNHIKEAGFKTLDFITMPDFNVLNYLDNSVLTAAKKLYPNLTLNDLLCSNVYFLIQK